MSLHHEIHGIKRMISKLRKATICFVMSVRPCIRLSFLSHGTRLPMDGFSLNLTSEYFSILRQEIRRVQPTRCNVS